MTELLQKQMDFTKLVAILIDHAHAIGYDLTFGEAWRPPETAAIYAKQGKGIKNSLHTQRLAVDFNLFKDGHWMSQTSDFDALGKFWEGLSRDGFTCCWGGRFGDGNHFSIEHNGVK